jgi:hypothetical protein
MVGGGRKRQNGDVRGRSGILMQRKFTSCWRGVLACFDP